MTIVRAADLDLTAQDLSRAAARFGSAETEPLGGFENLLLRSSEPPGRVLRLTHTSRRSVEMIEAEFEFMAHVAAKGVPVVAPVRSVDGGLVEEVTTDSGERLVVACMEEAPGAFRPRDQWSRAEVETYGELLGAMHAATQDFEPSGLRRPDWTDPIFDVGFDAAVDPEIVARLHQLTAECKASPAGGTELLIHQDAHYGNLFLTEDGRISLFDFDDCGYGTPTHDVAIVLWYWLMGVPANEIESRTAQFVGSFMRGYERHSKPPADWPTGADLFLSFREIDIYWLIAQEDVDDASPMEKVFMERRRQRILDGVPYLGRPLSEIV